MIFCKYCASILEGNKPCNCKESLSDRLLHYGEILIDNNINVTGFYVRQRLIKYHAEIYLHVMLNGDILVCNKIEEQEHSQ